ncbi:MAG: tetratricopeptide repeat protein [Phycisphaerae bacterium]|nr:tetratricopeptide repeat protein [Phycisphaerae bacterium]
MKTRNKRILKLLGAFAVGFVLALVLLAYWIMRAPTTELVDASGRQLTAGAPSVAPAEGFGGPYFADARALIETGQFSEAKQELLRIIEDSDRDGEACVLLCDVLRELKEADAAADYGLKAVKLLPGSPQAHLAYAKALGAQMFADMQSIGGMFSAMKRIRPFKEALQHAIDLDPDDIEARTMLVFFNLAPKPIGDIDRAIETAREIESLDPVAGKRLLAMCYQRQEDTKRAKEILLAGIQESPQEPGLHASLADIYAEEKQFDAADAEYESARHGPRGDDYYRSLYNQARMRIQNKFEPERAIELLDQFIAGDPRGENMPTMAHANWRKGNALEQLGRDEEARAAYEESLRRDPEFKLARESLEGLEVRLNASPSTK